MPFKSEAQRKWAYTKEGTRALGGKKAVAEWEKAAGDRKLPKYAKKKGKYCSYTVAMKIINYIREICWIC